MHIDRRQVGFGVFWGFGFLGLLAFSAWAHIQGLRLSYRNAALRDDIHRLERREQVLLKQIHSRYSLEQLDRVAREQWGLRVPTPDQIRLLPEPT